MKIRKIAIPAIALTLASPLFAHSTATQAADKPTAASPAKASPADAQSQAMARFSEAGNTAMRDIRGARFAIFNGDTKGAMKLMESAVKFVGQAEKEAPVYDTTATMLVGGKVVGTTTGRHEVTSVPVDGQLMLADSFVATPEKKAHIDKANEHLKKGEHAKALEELRLGEIDVTYTRSWLPIAQARKHLEQAVRQAADGKYYEANLSLKAIEDSVTMDTVALRDLPKLAAKRQ